MARFLVVIAVEKAFVKFFWTIGLLLTNFWQFCIECPIDRQLLQKLGYFS